MNRIIALAVPVAGLFLGILQPLKAELTPQNALEYFGHGSLNYSIAVHMADLDLVADPVAQAQSIAQLEKKLAASPDSLNLASQLLDLLDKAPSTDKAKNLALRFWPLFKAAYDKTKDNNLACEYGRAVLAAGAAGEYANAINLLSSIIHAGWNKSRAYQLAIDLYMAQDRFQEALIVAHYFQQDWPNDAQANYSQFNIMLAYNLLALVNQVLENSKNQYSAAKHNLPQNKAEADEFFQVFLTNSQKAFNLEALDRAVRFSDGDYQINTGAATFRLLMAFYGQIQMVGQLKDFNPQSIVELFSSGDSGLLKPVENCLQAALKHRPPRDIQVFMALALQQFLKGDTARAGEYASQAIKVRPDLPKPYDALICIRLAQVANLNQPDFAAITQVLEDLLAQKKLSAGLSAADWTALAAVGLHRLKAMSPDSAQRPALLEATQANAKQAIAAAPDSPEAIFVMGGSLVAQAEYRQALDLFARAIAGKVSQTDQLYFFQGLCRLLLKDKKKGLDDLRQALSLNPDLKQAKELLDSSQ